MDQRIADQVFDVVAPAGVEAACEASRGGGGEHDEVIAALRRDLEAASYAARRAERQFNAADPENRLVVDELERRWNQALKHVQDLEHRIESHNAGESLLPGTITEFSELAENLKAVWDDETTDVRLKKQIIRTLIKEVVADVTMTYLDESEQTKKKAPGDLLGVEAKFSIVLSDYEVDNMVLGSKVSDKIDITVTMVGSNAK